MKIHQIGITLILLGCMGFILSLAADFFGIGRNGIQASQILGAEASFVLALLGIAVCIFGRQENININDLLVRLKNWLSNIEPITWVLLGFLLAYFYFFLLPMFFNERIQFQYFYRYLPETGLIGSDTRFMIKSIKTWLVDGQSPYSNNGILYPPFYNIFFAPLILISFPTNYYLITAVTIIMFLLTGYFVSTRINRKPNLTITLFVLLTSIFSYGFQFEIERGQFNLIAFSFCLVSIYIFHFHPKFRIFAYLFFTISVQLKAFPIIFIIMFISDWRFWKTNLLRLFGLGITNFGMLFILGYPTFLELLSNLLKITSAYGALSWMGNHSIKAFLYNLELSGYGWLSDTQRIWVGQNQVLLNWILIGIFGVCLIISVLMSFMRKETGFNPMLLLLCAVGALVLPSFSHDYTLPVISVPFGIMLSHLTFQYLPNWKKILMGLLVLIASFAYSATLFPFRYRSGLLENAMPLLFIILIAFTVIYIFLDNPSRTNATKL